MSKTNFIVINGKKYNASTGQLIRDSVGSTETVSASSSQQQVKSVDGVARHRAARAPARNTKKPVQKSSTLMRKAVKKPASTTMKHAQKRSTQISKSSLQVKPQRAIHATAVQKSPLVQKYGSIEHRTSVRKAKIAELPVKQPSFSQDTQNQPQLSSPHSALQKTSSAAHALIDSALHTAQSHTQQLLPEHTPRKKRLHHKLGISTRVVSVATGSLAVLLLVGFFALQNIPNLSMRVAASRSGVNSSMPGYTPSGFTFRGPIDYSQGVVTVSFKSNSDDRAYSITQRNSAWTSDSLLAEFVVDNSSQYQTYLDDRGRTLYIYDKNNATWVQDGIWYKVEGDSKLTTDQLARLAASM